MHHRRHLHITSPEGSTFLAFFGLFLAFLCTKAVHNLKTKRSGTILTLWARFVLISAFLFLVSEVALEKNVLILAFLQTLPQ